MKIDVCFSPALFSLYEGNTETIVIVVDIFRATTCMCVAFETGVHSIRTVADLDLAKKLKREGFLVGAERNIAKCDFADFGNSPVDYKQDHLKSKDIVMTTTNGTKAIEIASRNHELIIGAFSNIKKVAEYCLRRKKDVLVLCAGWNERINLEDSLFAGALCEQLFKNNRFSAQSDAAIMANALWEQAKDAPKAFLKHSEHIQRLLKFGLENDIDFCLQKNTSKVLPYFCNEKNVLLAL